MNSPPTNYGTQRERAASVSFAEIESAARKLMAAGDYPSVAAVRKALTRGSTTTIADAMRRFWKDQAALNAGDPVALTRLPPEFADAAVELWERALRLSLQTAKQEDNAARAHLDELRRSTEAHALSVEMREKHWDMAARVRERALTDSREHVDLLLRELASANAELRTNKTQMTDLQAQMEDYRRQISTMIARVANRKRKPGVKGKAYKKKNGAPRTRSKRTIKQGRRRKPR